MRTRDRIHGIVDAPPDLELPAINSFLDTVSTSGSPLRRALASATVDDEPLSIEDDAAISEAYADVAAGRIVSDDDLWRRLGHTPAG